MGYDSGAHVVIGERAATAMLKLVEDGEEDAILPAYKKSECAKKCRTKKQRAGDDRCDSCGNAKLPIQKKRQSRKKRKQVPIPEGSTTTEAPQRNRRKGKKTKRRPSKRMKSRNTK